MLAAFRLAFRARRLVFSGTIGLIATMAMQDSPKPRES